MRTKFRKITGWASAIKSLVVGVLFLLITVFLAFSLWEIKHSSIPKSLVNIPNHNYIPEIEQLKNEGKLSEALELARFIRNNPDMPGQEQAAVLEQDLEHERNSITGKSKRVARGFIAGTGNSVEELSGSIASDMLIWGDIRDLGKQGYYKVTGSDKVDPFIAALAGIGLATEAVDFADWAPAVLKAFRKIGALSKKFGDFVITAARKSVKAGKLNGPLVRAFKQLRGLANNMGLARTASIFKHVDTPKDLSIIHNVAKQSPDAAYFTMKNGGKEGVNILKQTGQSATGIKRLNTAAKKGPAGISWLKRGGKGRKYLMGTRITARVIKNLKLQRPQELMVKLASRFKGIYLAIVGATALSGLFSIFCFIKCVQSIYTLMPGRKIPATTSTM